MRAAAAGIPTFVPEGELVRFTDLDEHCRTRPSYVVYDNGWDPLRADRGGPGRRRAEDEARIRLAGLGFTVVPLPGATVTQIGCS